jgi:16S rRNA processing protein RimM
VRGEVRLDVRTDSPASRFVPGARLATDSSGHLTLASARHDRSGWFVRFAEAPTREDAEALRGTLLLADDAAPPEPDAWYPDELRGLALQLPDGTPAGQVTGVIHGPAQDLLEIRQPSGAVALLPFVQAIVPEVDVLAGRIVTTPPPGLLEVAPIPPEEELDEEEGALDGEGEA